VLFKSAVLSNSISACLGQGTGRS